MTLKPLSRNHNYQLLWGSQALSEFGINVTSIAFPLLVLVVTGSPGASGLVLGASAAAHLLAGLPAGALVDRWNRKTVMLACEAVQAVTVGSLVLALWWDTATVAHMVVVAAVLGVCGSMFEPAEEASLPNVVPAEQLPTALAMNSARSFLAQLSGTAAGGFLFAVGRVVPFVVETVTHAVSFVALLFLRMPPRRVRSTPMRHLGREMAEGVRWMWRHRHVRATALCVVGLNLFFAAYYLVIIVLAQQRGVPTGEIGIMAAMFGAGGLLGAVVAPRLMRILSPYGSIVGVCWILTALTPISVFVSSGYLMGLLLAAMAFLAPTTNTAIDTYQLLVTPDELRGRLSGVMGVAGGIAAAAGPAAGGALLELVPGNQVMLLCAGGIALLTLSITVSPTMRSFPRTPPAEADSPTTVMSSPIEKGTADG
ncbi:MAG TPA: MFS transporter [Actinophytocola sp.]|uniref:MFS transporter n=1 Tax=Actinophytocola sp. TaxID=1872138 RepID=UPI002DDCEDF1|nr:MFS transporter [Actinophytocola sp.]HEV2782816.1 MFS transporter [Actinophytocola sp.]